MAGMHVLRLGLDEDQQRVTAMSLNLGKSYEMVLTAGRCGNSGPATLDRSF